MCGLALTSLSAVAAQTGLTVFATEGVTVRAGPGTVYDRAGELAAQQSAAALGRSEYNDWIQIEFANGPDGKGWVYAKFVELQGGQIDQLPLAESPGTPTLPPTPQGEVDPLSITLTPTRLPTYTPAPPVTVPVFQQSTPASDSGFPSILLIFGLLALGVFGVVMATIRRNA
jgi:hypothetical protein